MKYQHIFFDLDHTLWDFDANAKECLEELYEVFGLRDRHIDTFRDFYVNYDAHNQKLWNRYEQGYITGKDLKFKRMWLTLLDFKIADEKLSWRMSDYYDDILPRKDKVFEYTFEILDYLTHKGYQLNLLTNGFDKSQRGKLASSKIDGYFVNIITSEIANSTKPRKEIFDFALRQTGGSVDDSIMIGDNPDTDIAGALNVGMDCVYVDRNDKDIRLRSTYKVKSLKQLEDFL